MKIRRAVLVVALWAVVASGLMFWVGKLFLPDEWMLALVVWSFIVILFFPLMELILRVWWKLSRAREQYWTWCDQPIGRRSF